MTAASEPVRRLPRQLLLPAVSAALLLLVLALPNLAPPVTDPEPVSAHHARIVALLDPNRPNPDGAGLAPDARVLVLDGPQAGTEVEAYLEGPGGRQDTTGYRVGEDVVVTFTQGTGDQPFVAVSDRWRVPQLAVLVALFVIGVVLVGGWRGVRAILALALTAAIVVRVLVPLVLSGVPPIPVAVVLATAIVLLTIGLTEGFNRTSVAAILGTAAALSLTAILAAVAIALAGFSNTVGSELIFLELAGGEALDLRGLLLAAFILGAIGVLDDVTVTQAAAVDELAVRGGLRGRALYGSALNVGRSHIAATVNTLFLAYVGASLPLIVLLVVSRQPAALTVNGELVAIEIVRTLVGSLGIVAAVPLTTLIAVAMSRPGDARSVRRPWRHQPAVVLLAGLVAIGLVTAVAAMLLAPMVGMSARTAVAPDRFESPLPSDPAGVPNGGASMPPLEFVEPGAAMPLREGDATVGEVTVLRHRRDSATELAVEVRYVATDTLTVRSDAWYALPLVGEQVPAVTGGGQAPALEDGTLQPGESRTGWLEFTLTEPSDSLFLEYRAPDGTPIFAVDVS